MISHNGFDDDNCGANHQPCRTLLYIISKRANSDDIIKLETIRSDIRKPYLVDMPLPLLKNITLIGIGPATIKAENLTTDSHLFNDAVKGSHTVAKQVTNITVRMINVRLMRTGIVRVTNPLIMLFIEITNCTVSQLIYDSTSSIINSSATRTFVLIKDSIFYNIWRGLYLNSTQVEIKMEASKILHDGRRYFGRECPQFIFIGQFSSLSAYFVKCTFKRVFLIDLEFTDQRKSVISIINSTFNDERLNSYDYVCSSTVRLHRGTAFIQNARFLDIYKY